MTLERGCPINLSLKQKINMHSLTEAELVGVNDSMIVILWNRMGKVIVCGTMWSFKTIRAG